MQRRGRLVRRDAAWGARRDRRAFGLHDIHANEELEEGRDTGESGADGYGGWFTTREADGVSEAEDILRRDLIGRLMEATEEVARGCGSRSPGCGWSLSGAAFSREEGVERALPSGARTREDEWGGFERKTWRTPWLGNVRMTFALVCRYSKHYV